MGSPGAAPTSGSLKPLSLAPRPLQLRSASPAVTPSSNSNGSTPTGTPKEGHTPLVKDPTTEISPGTSRGPLVNGSVQRHQKRFSTLSYSSSPRSPSAHNTFQSPVQSSFCENGDYESSDIEFQGVAAVAKLANGGLSRNSSRSWKNGRNSVDVSLMTGSGKRGSLYWERSEHGSPGSADMSPGTGRIESAGAVTPGELTDEPVTLKDATQGDAEIEAAGGPNANVVLTLAEKHADLLHFIAQKEAKCLELRTQLTQHEADLNALKSKWTSIVQKANPSSSTSTSGSITLAGAAVIREGVGRLFSNVTAPLVSALDVVEPGSHPDQRPQNTQRQETDSSNIPDGGSSSFFPKLPALSEIKKATAISSRGHTPVSSNRSSASSFAVSGHSVSSNSSMSPSSFCEEGSSTTRDESGNDTIGRRTEVGSNARTTRRTSTLGTYSLSMDVTSNGSSASTEGNLQPSNPLTSWTAVLSDMDASQLNKKWEEIQKGDAFSKGSKKMSSLLSDVSSSFINTFAPPINEPIRPTKPRITSTSSSSQTSQPPFSQTQRPSIMSTSSSSKSLLDDDNELLSEMSSLTTTVHTMVPIKPSTSQMLMPTKPSTPSASPRKLTPQGSSEEEDDEEWNW